jgi:hypothetical protein
MMTLYEFTVFGIYLAMLTVILITIQLTNPGKAAREALHPQIEFPNEKFVEDTYDVSDSEDEKTPFNPETESFKMTENPMFSDIESKKED